jgi:peptidoglycan/xylan/chitin deacetylase (PgdA/CDA1 family)
MSLALPAVLAVVLLGLSGCSGAAGPRVLPASSASPIVTDSPAVTPSATVTASPVATETPTPAVTPTATCADGHVTVSQSRATESGPHGSVRVTGSDTVALTFDDGPDPVNTPAMLDVLKACGVKATFCLIGNKVRMYAAVVRRIVAEGHTLCNHTWDHNTQLGSYGQEMIRQNLQETLDAIHSVVPLAPVRYFRAPGGVWTDDYVTVAHELGMTPIDWDVDPCPARLDHPVPRQRQADHRGGLPATAAVADRALPAHRPARAGPGDAAATGLTAGRHGSVRTAAPLTRSPARSVNASSARSKG